ncbi:DUF3397 family protein [Cohnella sp. CFH 77786]|uniref:DUF3397 domain-containing protein n=1 Tax=Cohnella sp. CFH 77786 TaxID=2662265 RepID=UPI001C60B70C|nr:DUF3397 domain-containing protein [Cohnella sp. CFH 77786]MBW5444842.1 DUF3397 family protein [Cohnella sp. CFH 77786]
MSGLWKALTQTYMVMAGLPFIPFLIVYAIGVVRGMEKKKAIRLSMDVTNVFLIGIVAALLSKLSGSSFGFYFILLVMLIGAGLLGNAQNRIRGKIDPYKIVRAIWRLSFFAMALLYVLLMSLQLILPSSANS